MVQISPAKYYAIQKDYKPWTSGHSRKEVAKRWGLSVQMISKIAKMTEQEITIKIKKKNKADNNKKTKRQRHWRIKQKLNQL